ncbi:MAG: hypothetical protein WC141_07370 [Arcobacteraceae bacterium]
MFKNILKIVFLGLIGFSALVYFTANKPKQIEANQNSEVLMTKEALPQSFELVGNKNDVMKDELFKEGTKTLIVVGNHDSLVVVKELNNYFPLDIPFVMVANISSAPWFVKKLFIPSKLEELNKGSNIAMIYDFNGDTVHALEVTNNEKTAFIAYILDENNGIRKIYEGSVKEGALDGSMSEEEKKEVLQPLFELINE